MSEITTIELDLDDDTICDILNSHCAYNFSEASYSILEDLIKPYKAGDVRLQAIFTAAGRALFNEILLAALKDKMNNEQWLEEISKQEFNDDSGES